MNDLVFPPLSPSPLAEGDSVAITAPASPISPALLHNAVRSVEFLGLKPVVMASCKMSHGYLSGEDEARAADINDAFAAKEIKGIFCLRGGYGCMRLLPFLDYQSIRQNPKVFIGYSDITALHTAINKLSGLITFHGPMPSIDYTSLDRFTLTSLKTMLFCRRKALDIKNPCDQKITTLLPGSASGMLTGGNLALLASTLGSPYEVNTKGRILFMEDVNEPPYRLDRAFTALSLAGKFEDCSGIILGTFKGCCQSDSGVLSIYDIVREVILKYGKPTVINLRAGHVYPQLTLPMGEQISLTAHEKTEPNISVL